MGVWSAAQLETTRSEKEHSARCRKGPERWRKWAGVGRPYRAAVPGEGSPSMSNSCPKGPAGREKLMIQRSGKMSGGGTEPSRDSGWLSKWRLPRDGPGGRGAFPPDREQKASVAAVGSEGTPHAQLQRRYKLPTNTSMPLSISVSRSVLPQMLHLVFLPRGCHVPGCWRAAGLEPWPEQGLPKC